MGAASEDSNTVTSLAASPVTEPVPEIEMITSDTPEVPRPETPEEKEERTDQETEESHTPPLPPEMKKKLLTNPTSEKKTEKAGDARNKINDNKNNNWDMFAEQDIFKTELNVSLTVMF